MCGLAGLVTFDGAPRDPSLAAALGAALAHRGPDAEGVFASERALLVHRRLAIIDPSDAGAQPMSHAQGRFQLVYNGEAYNYRELRAELQTRGEVFRTGSDTEVVLRLLASEGPRALARVRGMFALAIWDEVDGTLTIARDRFGIKPVYVAAQPGRVGFASEIGALRRARLASRDVSAAGVLAYLSWASIPAPLTWLHGVEALEPGTWCTWSAAGRVSRGRFAETTAAYVSNGGGGDRNLRDAASCAVRDSVRAHLVADVPVGVFLSGGVDSGAIVSAARSVSDADLQTFTVVVDDADYNEGPVAARVAAHFGTTHHELHVDARAIAADLPNIVERLDQPTADAVNTYYVSRAVARTGVKAVLSGIGGDEMFGGYPSFERVPAGLQLARMLGPAIRATGAAATVALPAWRAAKWRHFASEPEIERGYRALRGFFMPEELDALVGPALADAMPAARAGLAAAEERLFAPAGEEAPVAAVARMETRMFLGSQLLRDVDAVSMAHALEVRVPFVDHLLQGTVWPALARRPELLKRKALLHGTLARPLPEEIVTMRKRGFTLPFDRWLHDELRETTRAGLAALASGGWLDRGAPERVWKAWEAGQAHWSRAWGLGLLGRFLEEAP